MTRPSSPEKKRYQCFVHKQCIPQLQGVNSTNSLWKPKSLRIQKSVPISIIPTDGRKPMHEAPNHANDTYHTKFQPVSRKPSGLGWSVYQEDVPSYNTPIKNVKDIPDPRKKNQKHDKDGGCGCSIL
ncbi:predicted protein [Sclerotinia sclerotiorum 1980 UF-70]|uniref:Uncharacterized protein n=2 Tax=Sclerotinia sclerotiorum (strain ATCC 18683 / 1980 / Ss-1) TaxID=665079 RepID=A7EXR7_SCLS1|nr:predicted protein [Sclerotinia sclerotiorum 1980 UF-70]APA16021.1 hypothetical protein sscle_16g107910 [Sclerotinia sclerotiorum 1980 UF-70]EDN94259.1 predicted protein [Sclerotinia sclerotiorum 1980 UF-70]